MERMVLIGAGEGCVDIVREAIKEYDFNENVDVTDVVIDSDELHNTLFEDRFRVKNFVDHINAWHSETAELSENTYSRTMHGVHYYTSMLVIEKEKVGYPRELMIGHEY